MFRARFSRVSVGRPKRTLKFRRVIFQTLLSACELHLRRLLLEAAVKALTSMPDIARAWLEAMHACIVYHSLLKASIGLGLTDGEVQQLFGLDDEAMAAVRASGAIAPEHPAARPAMGLYQVHVAATDALEGKAVHVPPT